MLLLVVFFSCKEEKNAPIEQQKLANYYKQYEIEYLEIKKTNNDLKVIDVNNKMRNILQSYNNRNIKKWIGQVNHVKSSEAFGSWVNVSYKNIDFNLVTDLLATKGDTLNEKLIDSFSNLKEGDWILFDGKLDIVRAYGGLYSGNLKDYIEQQTIYVQAINVEIIKK
jgi:thymidylate kinase